MPEIGQYGLIGPGGEYDSVVLRFGLQHRLPECDLKHNT
jgi:hypothetical protein